MNDTPLLDIRDLRVWYPSYLGWAKVLDGVDLCVRRGEKVGLVGEAGCGKTTTMKAVLGLLPKSAKLPSGDILFEGESLLRMKGKQLLDVKRKSISMVFQEPASALNPVFTVGAQMAEVVRAAETARGVRLSKKDCLARAAEALAQVYIPDPARILGCYPHQLSGGMKQRVCIAMSVMTHRDLLIADEPGTALDVTIQAQVHALINRLHEERGMSLIMVSHSLGVARELTDRIYVMYAGTIVETAPTNELFRRTLHPYTAGLLAAVPRLTGERFSEGIYGYIPDYYNVPEGCRFAARCPYATDRCRTARPALRERAPGHFAACFRYGEETDGK